MLGVEFVVAVEQVIIGVVVSKFLEEETAPDLELFHRRHLLQLVDIALFVIDVERVQIVAC